MTTSVYYDTSSRVLICVVNGCGRGMTPKMLDKHLRRQHSSDRELREAAMRYVATLSNVRLECDAPPMQHGSAQHTSLRLEEGFQCKECNLIMGSRKAVKVHGNRQHSLVTIADAELYDVVATQSWYGGNRNSYWRVKTDSNGGQVTSVVENSSAVNIGSTVDVALSELRTAAAVTVTQRAAERNRLTAAPPADALTPWLRHTQWNDALTACGLPLAEIANYAQAAQPNEPELHCIEDAFDRIIERAVGTLQTTDPDLLLWLASPKHEAPKQKPFQLPQDPGTLVRYRAIWKRFLYYVIRTAPEIDDTAPTPTAIKFNPEQLQAVGGIRQQYMEVVAADYEGEALVQLDSLVFALTSVCIQQRLDGNEPFTSLLMHWLAVEGIHGSAGRLRRPQDYTRVLAATLYINRLLTLEYALPRSSWWGLELVTRSACNGALERLQAFRRAWLCEGSASPTSKVLRQLAYGKAIIKTEGSAPAVNWSENGDTLWFEGRAITMQSLQQGIKSLIEATEKLLDSLMFGDRSTVDLKAVQDSLTWSGVFNSTGYSFVTATRNRLDVGFDKLLKLTADLSGSNCLVKRNGDGLQWHERRCSSYLQQERQFLNQLLACMHLCGGQPARGSEIGSIKVCNTTYNQRNIYILDGEVVFITAYDKNMIRRDNVEYIIRYLPGKVGRLLARYLVFVRPFARALPIDRRNDDYLFATSQGPFNGRHASAALASSTKLHLGYAPNGLNFSSWRHIAIAIARQHLRAEYSRWRTNGADEGDSESEEEESIWDRQAGHGTRTAHLHYAVQAGFLQRIQQPQLNQFRLASHAWHALMVCFSTEEAAVTESVTTVQIPSTHRRMASRVIGSEQQKRQRRQTLLPAAGIEHQTDQLQQELRWAIERVIGPGARYRSQEQEDAMRHVLRNDGQSIVILRTAGGKSLLFMGLATLQNDRAVIVVVPCVALIQDLLMRAAEHSVDAMQWTETTTRCAALVVVSADVATQPAFLHYATQLAAIHRLRHVFFDECHVAITDVTFRQSLRQLWMLRNIPAPFTALTATLPPVLEEKLREALLLPNATMFRRPTAWFTIAYAVCNTAGQPIEEVTIATANAKAEQWAPGERGVIYVRSIGAGTALAEQLDCLSYNAQDDARDELLQQWLEGTGGWIIATGALGTGVDIARIRTVLHSGRPYGMINFMQQSGRGGRNGERSDSVIIENVAATMSASTVTSEAYATITIDEEALTRYIQGDGCRREIIGDYMDGLRQNCTDLHAERCDFCMRATRHSHVVPVAAMQARVRHEAVQDDNLLWTLGYFGLHCVFCTLVRDAEDEITMSHRYESCGTANERSPWRYADFRQWRRQLRFPDYSSCFRCGLTQDVCDRLKTGENCVWPDVMLVVLYLLHTQGLLVRKLRSWMGYSGQDEASLLRFLSGAAENMQGARTRAMVIFSAWANEFSSNRED